MKRLGLVVVLVAVVAAGCGRTVEALQGPSTGPGTLSVVTTTTFLADMVRQVGGSRVSVRSLVPKGGDVHTFDPRPSDALALSEAKLVIMNGLGLDDWVGVLIGDVGTGAPVVRVGEGLAGVDYIRENGVTNPHLWLDVAYGVKYVDRIERALAAADPANAAAYAGNGAGYSTRLAALDAWARTSLAGIPATNRRIVSFHDALPYFCRAYGLDVVGNVVSVPGQEPSAREIRQLVDSIRAARVKAIFSEAQFNPDLARTIASETGASVVSNLYTDTLGDPPADTYEGIVRWDVERFVEALR